MAGQLLAQAPADPLQFPILLHPGDNFTVQNQYLIRDSVMFKGSLRDSIFTVDVKVLYVLLDKQARNLVKKAKKQEVDSLSASILEKQVGILKEIRKEKEKIISLNREGYLHYRDLWEATDRQLEEEEIKSSKNFKWGFYVGVAVSIVTITSFKLIADKNF
jgi:hypothetical protein